MSIEKFLRIFCIFILPFVVAFYMWLIAPSNNGNLKSANNRFILFIYAFIVLLLAFTPATYWDGSDKGRYMYEFDHIQDANIQGITKDIGWYYFVRICNYVTFGTTWIYFLFTAFIFSSSFYYFAKKEFSGSHVGYLLLLTCGMLGFSGYSNNVIRNGVAVALCLYALTSDRRLFKYVLPVFAYFIHGSVMILIASYFVTIPLKSIKLPMFFWVVCLFLSITRVDISTFFTMFGMMDKRVLEYTSKTSADVLAVYAKAGMFRWDFLIYSVVPLCIAWWWINRYNYHNRMYIRFVNIYLLCNALWLLVIRQAYSDRFAFLSWLMIPIITLYPILRNEINVINPEKTVYLIIMIFTSVNACLSILSIL